MEISYDPRYNIAYLKVKEKTEQVETILISDSINVDLAPDGTLYGIEFLNANEQLMRNEIGKLALVNEFSGKKCEVEWP